VTRNADKSFALQIEEASEDHPIISRLHYVGRSYQLVDLHNAYVTGMDDKGIIFSFPAEDKNP
jgi:cystathionine beta-lyase/cystathionine gamma-synthase